MYFDLRLPVQLCVGQFDAIPLFRKTILSHLADYIRQKYKREEVIHLNYICTHNSRRSHFGQVAGALAAHYYAIDQVFTYSGGTETTAVNPQAIAALNQFGFKVEQLDYTLNPKYKVSFGPSNFSNCFSKVYDDVINPKVSFAAIMTCGDADANCPYIPGADHRFTTTYEDPKLSDGTQDASRIYLERFKQILTENLFVCSLV